MHVMNKHTPAQLALRFVIIIGIVNFFADFTYEGARGINGAFLASLGASSVAVGFVAGFGELIGYAFRSVTGFFADKSHRYWVFSFIGYAVNMLAVPALALAGNWPVAATLMIAERTGRAFRKPAMDTMLSFAGDHLGSGWVFGMNEFLDQFGATLGPLIVAWVLYLKGSYKGGYAVLLVSALACLAMLAAARLSFPQQQEQYKHSTADKGTKGLSRRYWHFVLAGALIAAGFADFSLIAFHFEKTGTVSMEWIPILYAIAMITAGFSSLVFGKFFDTQGVKILLVAFFLGALFAPFSFLGTFSMAFIGMIFWGIGTGAQDSLLKASVANMISREKRGTAFGVFDTIFGIAWFLGSSVMGILYAQSIPALIAFSVILQLTALPMFALALKPLSPLES